MSDIEWKENAVCYAYGKQWFVRDNEDNDLTNKEGNAFANSSNVIMRKDFQLNEITTGDFIPASELDTEQKYNEVVEVSGLFGFELFGSYESFNRINDCNNRIHDCLTCKLSKHKGLICIADRYELNKSALKRKLTHNQIIAIGKLKRMMLERAVPAVEFEAVADNGNTDQVKNPSHYQLIDGVESIEIIARSMTKEQWKGFCLGNMLKYRIRAGKKDALQQDIEKANFYGELYEMHKEKCYG